MAYMYQGLNEKLSGAHILLAALCFHIKHQMTNQDIMLKQFP